MKKVESGMKKALLACSVVLSTTILMPSCLSDDDDTTLYDDVAITSATLGTLNRYLTTTGSDGRDSVYKRSYSASTLKLVIDQLGGRIYCEKPLLLGTDLKHVVCSLATKNNALVAIKSTTSDSLTIVTTKDSIDFSVPRTLRVISSDTEHWRDYVMTLTVRQQEAGVLTWTEKTGEVAEADINLVSYPDISQVVGYANGETYGYGWDGHLKVSRDGGDTWTDEQLDAPEELLPRQRLTFATWATANNVDYALMAGVLDEGDTTMTLWRKLIDHGREGRWVYMTPAEDNPYLLPAMEQVTLTYCAGYLLAAGSNGTIYRSQDQGITWKTGEQLTMPADFGGAPFQLSSRDDVLWLKDKNGRTWQGVISE